MHLNFWQRDEAPSEPTYVESDAYVADVAVSRRAYVEVSEKAQRYNTITSWILYVGAFLLPLFFLPWTTSNLELSKQTLLVLVSGAGLVTWLLGVVISGQIKFRSGSIDSAVLGLLVATSVATLFSVARMKSLFGLSISLSDSLISILALTIIYFLAVNVFDDRGKKLEAVLVGSTMLALLYGLLQMFTVYVLKFDFAHSRAFNTVGSLNSLGVLAAVALPLFIKLKLAWKRFPYLDFAKIGVVVALAILVILNWWVLWAIAIAGMLALIAFDSVNLAVSEAGRKFSLSKFLMPMIVIVLGVFLLVVGFNLTSLKKNFPVEIGPSFSLSKQVAEGALSKNALTGYGPENYSIAFDQYGAKALANSTLSNLKFFDGVSQAMNVITQQGVIGAIALLFLLGTVGYVLVRHRSEGADGAQHSATGVFAALVAASVGMLLYSTNTTLAFMMYSLLALTTLAVWGGQQRVVNIEERPTFSLASSLGFIVGLIAVLTGAYFITIHYLADVDFANAQVQTDSAKAANMIVSSINWFPNDRYYRTASQVSLSMLTDELKKTDKSADRASRIQNLIVSSRDLAIQATQLDPTESNNWFNLGNIYESLIGLVENSDSLAEQAYMKASALRPGDASFANRIGSMYLSEAELDRQLARSAGANGAKFNQAADVALLKAEESFKKSIELSPNYGLAIYNLAAVYDRQGKTTAAITQIEKIAPFNAQDANLIFQLGLLYYRAGRKDDALAAMQQAVFLSPSFANARWYLGLIYEERKDFPNAIAQMQKILDTNKDNPTVTKKIADLERGISSFPPNKVIDQQPL